MVCKLEQKRNTSCSMVPQVHNRPRPLKFVTALAILASFPSRLRNQTIPRKHPKNLPIIPPKNHEGEKVLSPVARPSALLPRSCSGSRLNSFHEKAGRCQGTLCFFLSVSLFPFS